jgi:hypothetical protein
VCTLGKACAKLVAKGVNQVRIFKSAKVELFALVYEGLFQV